MHKVVFVLPLADYMLQLTFEDGTEKVVDLRPYIGKGISAALEDINYFRQVQIESGGGIAWPNGYDFCPNFLYEEVTAVELTTDTFLPLNLI